MLKYVCLSPRGAGLQTSAVDCMTHGNCTGAFDWHAARNAGFHAWPLEVVEVVMLLRAFLPHPAMQCGDGAGTGV